ncbi:myoD family inhibitor [Hippocampus comes]|uniref:myoD family inhibitor n=1 Tax=Hippocampus comes TaxID=109280 RepID=UPI00094E3767|nr:PREDICTED: myoD family inhibitor-like [Hippocampus comes]XP_019716377.1 PREDICTED: myoD family inhibitor-like [Hippocampus comes]
MDRRGGASECSDQGECISSQPTTGRPSVLLQSAGQHASLETDREVDVQINTPQSNISRDVTADDTSGGDNLPRVPLPPSVPTNQKRLSSSESHAPFKTNAALIEEVAGEDCCIGCLLACLFCELPSMCWAAERCVTCGGGSSGCCWFVDTCCWCCCCCYCWDNACAAPLDCGILEECCSSTDCLEICLECCAICFPS